MHLFLTFFFEIFGCARQYEQALLHSLARKFGCARHSPNKFGSALTFTKIALRFSAALGNMSKLYCTRLHENCFEIFGCARHSPNKFGSALACTKILAMAEY